MGRWGVTLGVYDGLEGPKEICVLEGERLPQSFDPGFGKGVEAMLGFRGGVLSRQHED